MLNYNIVKEGIINKMEKFNKFLILLVITNLFLMLFIKIISFNKINKIDEIQKNILVLKQESEQLNIELNIMSNPKRLEKLYTKLEKKYFNDMKYMEYTQIKDLNNLYPYFYSKIDNFNANNSIAVNEYNKRHKK